MRPGALRAPLACGLPVNFLQPERVTPPREGRGGGDEDAGEELAPELRRIAGAPSDRGAGRRGRRRQGPGRRGAGRERGQADRPGRRGDREGSRHRGGRRRRDRGRQDQGGRTGSGARGAVGLDQDEGRGRIVRPEREAVLHEPVRVTQPQRSATHTQRRGRSAPMKVSSVMSLVAATGFAVGILGPAAAQTPAPAAPKSGDASMDKMDKKDKKESGKAHKQHAAKKKPAAKKSDDTKASESKAPAPPKKEHDQPPGPRP